MTDPEHRGRWPVLLPHTGASIYVLQAELHQCVALGALSAQIQTNSDPTDSTAIFSTADCTGSVCAPHTGIRQRQRLDGGGYGNAGGPWGWHGCVLWPPTAHKGAQLPYYLREGGAVGTVFQVARQGGETACTHSPNPMAAGTPAPQLCK